MIRKTVYPKTQRIGNNESNIQIVEKLDGSNLVIMKRDNVIWVCQRNITFLATDLHNHKALVYKGLSEFMQLHLTYLQENLRDNTAICCEWLGMGSIQYNDFNNQLYLFAKSRIDNDGKMIDISYYQEFNKYAFINNEIPYFIGEPKIVTEIEQIPTIDQLDIIYDNYTEQEQRNIEGFIINNNNNVKKYVRMKNGKITPHRA